MSVTFPVTVGDLAGLLSVATRRDPDKIARQVRGWLQQGILQPAFKEARGPSGTIAAAMFDLRGVCAVRLMMALTDFNFGGADLKQAAQIMDWSVDPRLALRPINGTFPPRGIDAVIASVEAEERHKWWFELVCRVDAATGERSPLMGRFVRDDQPAVGDDSPLSPHYPLTSDGLALQGVLRVPASDLIKPFVALAGVARVG